MKSIVFRSRLARACAGTLIALFTCRAMAGADDAELQRLRAENARLKQALSALEARPGTTAPRLPAATSAPSPSVGAGAGMPAAASGAAVSSTRAAASTPPKAPPGYRLVPEPAPNSDSGCSHSMFGGTDAPWKHEESWSALHRGDSPSEVEPLLGRDHFDVTGDGRVMWQYGKCGRDALAFVVFQDGRLLFWRTPDF
jgi:hypothetical protein